MEYDDLADCQPNLGNEVDVCGATKIPRVKWNCSPYKNYSISIADFYPLGIKHPQLLQHGLNWWIVDIPGCNVAAGKTLIEYQQPLPLYGSGINRYGIQVFEQAPYPIDWSEVPYVPAT